MGFFVRLRLREDPVGSYPAFSPLPSTISCQVVASVSDQLPAEINLSLARVRSRFLTRTFASRFLITDRCHCLLRTNSAGRCIFCDTFRYPEFTSLVPPFSRGLLPFGVRTFLWPESVSNQRLPATACKIPLTRVEIQPATSGGIVNFRMKRVESVLVSRSDFHPISGEGR
jgi:hypothetical protein